MSKSNAVCELMRKMIVEARNAGEIMLPSSRKLCEYFRVSRKTLFEALDILELEGLLERLARSGIFLKTAGKVSCVRKSPSDRFPKTKAGLIVEDIAGLISVGELQHGDHLPLQKSLQFTYQVSLKTVRNAMAILEERSLIHRKGTKWLAGSAAMAGTISRKTVSVLDWDGKTNQAMIPTEQFRLLEGELSKHGADLVGGQNENGLLGNPATVNNANNDSLGYVIMNPAAWVTFEMGERIGSVRRKLRKMNMGGCPVVVFSANWVEQRFRGFSFRPYQNVFPIPTKNPQSGKEIATFLGALGHTHIAFFSYLDKAWCHERFEDLTMGMETAKGNNACVRHFAAKRNHDTLIKPLVVKSSQALQRINPAIARLLKGYRFARPFAARQVANDIISAVYLDQHLIGMIPLFKKALDCKTITAWVCADPSVAKAASQFLFSKGISVPERLSLAVFDDNQLTMQARITAYDMQTERRGYLAAHCLLGDIPIKRDRNGFVECPGQIIDRGSVGRAR